MAAGTTVQVAASNVTIAGFTITRLGNNPTDWNNPALNSAGIAIHGRCFTGMLVRDNIITGNRTAIDVNNSSGHTIRNNVITDNRTGLVFRNQTDNLTVIENEITNNWTVGILFLDASGGTNSPVQTALNCTFSKDNISGNWYGQVVDRQTGGSLPAPGANLKNFERQLVRARLRRSFRRPTAPSRAMRLRFRWRSGHRCPARWPTGYPRPCLGEHRLHTVVQRRFLSLQLLPAGHDFNANIANPGRDSHHGFYGDGRWRLRHATARQLRSK